ncbi:alpha-1,6-glucosidase domain-containing protein [Algibacillus agarilyticus]|uniref:alpha-1,6-glucosidase domain-containing protein n=1 Tax=Algibacillus agarilyticus TaxID=2234133 RepID=UPI000DCFE67A|nr:alpha-1,6-glucosidase domain-containing protein [Algibacillus agarilyticus]
MANSKTRAQIFKLSLLSISMGLLSACGGSDDTNSATENMAPVVDASASTDTVNEGGSFTLSASATDSDGRVTSYAWMQTGGTPVQLSSTNQSSIQATVPALNADETLTFTVLVSDNSRNTTTNTINVVAKDLGNLAPTIKFASTSTGVTSGESISISANASDLDGSIASYLWEYVAGVEVDLSGVDNTAETFTFVAPSVSSDAQATFSLTVEDQDGSKTTRSFAININAIVVEPVAPPEPGDLPAPVAVADANQVVLYYNRRDAAFDGWTLHVWNNEACDSYADFASDGGTEWDAGLAPTGTDPNYGAYWIMNLKEGHSDCGNLIIHNGADKDISQSDIALDLTGDRNIFTIEGDGTLYASATPLPDGIVMAEATAHWLDRETMIMPAADATEVRIYYSATADLTFNGATGIEGDNFIAFTPSAMTDAHKKIVPHLADTPAFTSTAELAMVKEALKGQLIAVAYATDGTILAATRVQAPWILDDIYTSGDNDADEATLGLIYDTDDVTAAVWAPTAQSVKLKVYSANKELTSTEDMTLDADTGIWRFTGTKATLDRAFYRYEVTVFHHITNKIETIESTDPYSVSLSTNGAYSQFVNLNDDDLKPANWESHTIPTITNIEDAVLLEGHIRDFSILDQTTTVANRGKYKAFTETGTDAVDYLKGLQTAGVTHFHMLPANDIATVNEDPSQTVDLHNTVAELCAKVADAPVCGVENDSATLLSVLQSYDPSTDAANKLVTVLRGIDSFNWGYDPHHFNVPEGSYSSNADGVARILEMREMNQALHEMGLRVVLDVVYNHTSASGLYDNSVFDKVVPGYYHRYHEITGNLITSTCCDNTATEHRMLDKFVVESLAQWAEQYKFDSFRFDIMGHMPKSTILAARDAVKAIDPDNYFYGEGWNWGEVESGRLFENAVQTTMAGTEVGTFNDRPRDDLRNAGLFKEDASAQVADHIRLGLAGTQATYMMKDQNGTRKAASEFAQSSYGQDPADIINYISKHDNETLWDQLQYGLPADLSAVNRARVHSVAASVPIMSQGIPFFQLGVDKMRSKSMDRNTYNSGDWYNALDYTNNSNNWNVGMPIEVTDGDAAAALAANANTTVTKTEIDLSSAVFAEFLSIRAASPLFRLTTSQDIIDRVGFHNSGANQTPGLIVMSLNDGTGLTDLDPANDAIVVVINATGTEKTHEVKTAQGFTLHPIQQSSADTTVQGASFAENGSNGSFTVPAYTTAVFVKAQSGAQSMGLLPDPDFVPAPYGSTAVYLRGDMNEWAATSQVSYTSDGIYTVKVDLAAGTYGFKFADADWSTVNLGFDNISASDGSLALNNVDGNISVTTTEAGTYLFSLNAANTADVKVSVTKANSLVACTAPTSAGDYPFTVAGGGLLYVRGDHSGWGADANYALTYIGDNKYQSVATYTGVTLFKLASDDGSWTTQVWAQNSAGDIQTASLALDTAHEVAYAGAGTDNNSASLSAGDYRFTLALNEADPAADTASIGSLTIEKCAAN